MNDSRTDAALLLLVVFIVGGAIAALVFVQIPQPNMTLFASLTTGLLTGVIGAYAGYRWGSSKGSATKDQAIADLAKGQG